MRILLISDYAYLAGGAELMMKRLRDELNRRGHEARLFSTDIAPDGAENFADERCIGTESGLRTLLQTANPWAARSLARLVREFRPQIAHLRLFLTQLSPLILPVLATVPTVYHLAWYRPICPIGTKTLPDGSPCRSPYGKVCLESGCLPLRDWPPLMLQMRMFRRWRRHIDCLVANSDELRSRLEAEGLGPAEVVHNGIPAGPPPRRGPFRPVIGFAGRLVPTKGAHVLLEAFGRVAQELPDARLILAGDGPERTSLERAARARGLEGKVEFSGRMAPDELADRFREVAVHVVPSLWAEPFGIVAVEAMMRGQPVIASGAGGLAEIVVHGETGLLVPPNDPRALAGAMLELLQNPQRALRMGDAAYRRALGEFTLERFYDRFATIYGELALIR